MDVFERAYAFAARWEGGLDDDPDDPGGVTKYGVSIKALKDMYRRSASFLGSIGVLGPITRQTIIDLTPEQAKLIFKREYWPAGFETLAETHPKMAFAAFDTALNMGMEYTRRLVQTAVGTTADGLWGPKTWKAIKEASDVLAVCSMIEMRKVRYAEIAEHRPASRKYLQGWLNRANALAKAVSEL